MWTRATGPSKPHAPIALRVVLTAPETANITRPAHPRPARNRPSEAQVKTLLPKSSRPIDSPARKDMESDTLDTAAPSASQIESLWQERFQSVDFVQ
jgi:hypothetical protein